MSKSIQEKHVLVFLLVNLLNLGTTTEHFTCETYDEIERSALISNDTWPLGVVPYELANLRPTDVEVFMQAVKKYETHTCIKLVPKKPSDLGFIKVSIEYPPYSACGGAEICFKNRSQVVKISHDCSNIHTFLHEIGHSLCLHHEHIRPDRDEFLTFDGCPPEKIPQIQRGYQTRGYFYDYFSQMHYGCYGKCWGAPKITHIRNCGSDANPTGLSIFDADKINEYYNCGGCHRHRWYNIDTITADQRKLLVNFGTRDGDKHPVHVCRTYQDGSIGIGTYDHSENACVLQMFGDLYLTKNYIQLFGIPTKNQVIVGDELGESKEENTYQLLKGGLQGTCETCVPAGRYFSSEQQTLFISLTEEGSGDGKKQTLVGFSDKFSGTGKFVSTVNGTRTAIFKNEFYTLHCN